MNPSPLSRLNNTNSHPSSNNGPQTPSSPSPNVASYTASPTPAQRAKPAASPRPRRALGDKGTPRTSRLGQEVVTASTQEDDEGDSDDAQMDVDDK